MSDKEMLEFAAKAAGIELWHEDVFTNGLTQKVSDNRAIRWNPLANDGDALRLAVKLRMNVFHAGIRVHAMDEDGDIEAAEGHETDPAAATRRAIVRAAVEIGRQMP